MDSSGGMTKAGYKVAFMCRINPHTVTKHRPNNRGANTTSLPQGAFSYWRVWDPNGIRPYGLLLKKIS